MKKYTRPNPSVLKEKLNSVVKMEVDWEEVPENMEQEPLRQLGHETINNSINSVNQKPNLKRKRTPTPPKSN